MSYNELNELNEQILVTEAAYIDAASKPDRTYQYIALDLYKELEKLKARKEKYQKN